MILIIGYGNPLRGDDAVGQIAARMLEERYRSSKLEVHAVYQLTPELAENISRAEAVIFIDAGMGEEAPGMILQSRIEPTAPTGTLTHHVTPAALLSAAHTLYGKAPPAQIFTVIGDSFAHSETLSPAVRAALPALFSAVYAVIQQYDQENYHA